MVFGNGYLGIASAVMALLILVLAEILPKTIGAHYWPAIAPVYGQQRIGKYPSTR